MKKVLLSLFITIFLVSCGSSGSNSSGGISNGGSPSGFPPIPGYSEITNLSEHDFHTYGNNYFLLKTDGKLYSWGDKQYLGYNAEKNKYNPKLIPALKDKLVKVFDDIVYASDSNVFYAITTDGKLYVWGNITNNFFGLEDGIISEATEIVIPNESILGVDSVSGTGNAIITTKSGDIYFTGNNQYSSTTGTIKIFSSLDDVVGKPEKVSSLKVSGDYVSLDYNTSYFSLRSQKEIYIWKVGEAPKSIVTDNSMFLVPYIIDGDNSVVYTTFYSATYNSDKHNYIYNGTKTYRYDISTGTNTEINFGGKTLKEVYYFLMTNTDDKLYQIDSNGYPQQIVLGSNESVKYLDYYYVITTLGNYYSNETYRSTHDKVTIQNFIQVNLGGDKVKEADDDYIITETGQLYHSHYSSSSFQNITPSGNKIKSIGSSNIYQGIDNKIYYYSSDTKNLTELQGVENSNLIKEGYYYHYLVTFNLENGSVYWYDTINGENTAKKVDGPLIKDISDYGAHGDSYSTFYIGNDNKIYNFGENNEYGKLGVGDPLDRSYLEEMIFE